MREIAPKDADYENTFLAKWSPNRYRYNKKSTYNLMAVGDSILLRGDIYAIKCKSIGAGIYEVWAEKR